MLSMCTLRENIKLTNYFLVSSVIQGMAGNTVSIYFTPPVVVLLCCDSFELCINYKTQRIERLDFEMNKFSFFGISSKSMLIILAFVLIFKHILCDVTISESSSN